MHLSNRQCTRAGWWLFVACAVCFIVAAARAGDMAGLAGAVLFMAANIAFMIPFCRRPRSGDHEE
ncbi:MAG TPA: cytochrome oxidase subunit III [Thermohalobaculum sp.]|nr:cytochrome oxidase subunit III [Thermohalobaculum sp.]